jgi:hypothetical protein
LVITVPIDLPVYRMNNGRTRSSQLEYVAEQGLAEDYFATGQENEEAQEIQHSLLEGFASEGTDSITPITEVLAQDGQQEPIVISPTGVVLNGNRRLAAMRLLFDRDPTAHASFANVECAVLPNLTAEQALDMEVRLQMTPQTLLDYSWVDEALTIEAALDMGKDHRQVAALMRKSAQAVTAARAALNEARIYLDLWEKKPERFHLVKNKQQFFTDLVKSLKNKGIEEMDASRRVAWMIESADGLAGRVYNYSFVFGESTETVVGKVAEKLGTSVQQVEASGDLEVDLGDHVTDAAAALVAFASASDDEATRQQISEIVEELAEELLTERNNAKLAAEPLKVVRRARSHLEGVQVGAAPIDDLPEVIGQLKELIIRAAEIQQVAQARVDDAS